MKVCDIVQFYSPLSGGVKRYIDNKIRYFATCGDIEHVVIVPSDQNTRRTEGRTRFHEVKSVRIVGSSSYRLLAARRRIQTILEEERPDLIEVGDPWHTAWIVQGLAHRLGIPVVAYYHSDYPRAWCRTVTRFCGTLPGRAAERAIGRYLIRLYNRMDATIVASARLRQALGAIGIERIHEIPLGTDTERFHPIDEHRQVLNDLGLPPEAALLLYVGRLAREKNVVPLIQMMDLFPDDGSVALLLVGDGEQRRLVQGMARRRRNVFWHPYCSSPELLSVFYSAADAFVHPGTCETFGLVALEAQACGTPVVAVRGGGVEGALAYEPQPALAENKSPAALHAATVDMLGRNETAEDRRDRRERIVRHFGRAATCAQLVELYKTVCAGRRS